jgi:hypothetical protein
MARSDGDPLRVEPMKVTPKSSPLGESQAIGAVGDGLKAPKMNGFIEGEATTRQAFTIGGDAECG